MYSAVALAGPTSTGKTDIAIDIARQVNAVLMPLDQLHRYKYMCEGSGLNIDAMTGIDYVGYAYLSPWDVSGPDLYIEWLRQSIGTHLSHRPVIIEGGCTSYLSKLVDSISTDSELADIEVYATDTGDEIANLDMISHICSLEKIGKVIDEVEELEKLGFITEDGIPFLLECEQLFKHPEYPDRRLAWAIRISAKIYCPAYLALKGMISTFEARRRVMQNILQIQTYQRKRIYECLSADRIYSVTERKTLQSTITRILSERK